MSRPNQFSQKNNCACGKLARFKVMVVMYPLGVVPRFTKSAPAIPICETCIQPVAKKVNSRTQLAIASGFAKASEKVLQAMPSTRAASK